MNRDTFIKNILPKTVCMTPVGFIAEDLSPNDFKNMHHIFFDNIFTISNADVTKVSGYGEFSDEGRTKYTTCRKFLIDTFADQAEGYWYHWRSMFETTILDQEVFLEFYKKMEERIEYCEDKHFLVNNNTFFANIITDGKETIGFPDWSRAAICDFLLDFAIMDLNKPYLLIPELLVQYCKKNYIAIPNFKERYLCMAYYKAIDTLRWHASIDDKNSCDSIIRYLNELENRIMNL